MLKEKSQPNKLYNIVSIIYGLNHISANT